jgi:hypothetical protein
MISSRKYPWAEMAVGETRLVGDTQNAQSAYVSLHRFREQCRQLGYPEDQLPRFTIARDRANNLLEITRLEDGPLREANVRAQETLQARREQEATYRALASEVEAWIADNNARLARGEGRLAFPPTRFAVLASVAPALADEVALIDSMAVSREPQHRMRRATDPVETLGVSVSDTYREPLDDAFARRLASACKSSQSR